MPIWTEGDRVEVGWGEAADSSNKTQLVVGVCGGGGIDGLCGQLSLEWSRRSLEGSRWDEKGDGGEEGAVAWGWRGGAGLVPKGSGWVGWVGVWGGVGGGGGGGGVGVEVGGGGGGGGSYWIMGEARCRSR